MIHPRHALARQSYPHHTGEHLSMLLFDLLTMRHQTRHNRSLPDRSEARPTKPICSNLISSPCHSLPNRGLLVPATEHHTTPRLIFSDSLTNLRTGYKRTIIVPTIFTWLGRMISNATTHEEKQWHEHSHDSEARTPHRHLTQHRHSRCSRAMPSRSATSRAVPNPSPAKGHPAEQSRALPNTTVPNHLPPSLNIPCRRRAVPYLEHSTVHPIDLKTASPMWASKHFGSPEIILAILAFLLIR